MGEEDPATAALARVRDATHRFPRHEPSAWLHQTAQAAALRISANGLHPPGSAVILPLVPMWPPLADDRLRPVHLCARCGATSDKPVKGFRTCGFEATSDAVPGVTLRFAFELCRSCAQREYGPSATREGQP